MEDLGIGRSAVMLRTCHSRLWENPRQCLGFLKVRVEGLGIGRSEGLPPGLQKEMQRDQIPGPSLDLPSRFKSRNYELLKKTDF